MRSSPRGAVESVPTTTILDWLASYHRAIEQPDDLVPVETGWVRVYCPQPAGHPFDPRSSEPTFVVNVKSGACRCSICGIGGTTLVLQRLIRQHTKIDEAAESRIIDYSDHVPIEHPEINIRTIEAKSIHFYRDAGGSAYLVALREPKIQKRTNEKVIYAHRRGNRMQWGIGNVERQLYRRELLDNASEMKMVVMVGDEVSADIVQGEIGAMSEDVENPDGVATTWLGSNRSWRYTKDFREPLDGANVVFWPDQTDDSIRTMLAIADIVGTAARNVWLVNVGASSAPEGRTPGGTITEGASMFDVIGHYAVKIDPKTIQNRRAAKKYDRAA